MRINSTCVGDLGRGGPGETGRSMWLEPASGLSGGLSSSGGDGVLASRSGPESLHGEEGNVEVTCGDSNRMTCGGGADPALTSAPPGW